MTDAQQWSVIIGAILPPILALIQQERWSSGTKALVAFVLCVAAAVGVTYVTGQVDWADRTAIATNAGIVFTMAAATYETFWKPTGVAPAIMHATNVQLASSVAPPPAPPAEPPAAAS